MEKLKKHNKRINDEKSEIGYFMNDFYHVVRRKEIKKIVIKIQTSKRNVLMVL